MNGGISVNHVLLTCVNTVHLQRDTVCRPSFSPFTADCEMSRLLWLCNMFLSSVLVIFVKITIVKDIACSIFHVLTVGF